MGIMMRVFCWVLLALVALPTRRCAPRSKNHYGKASVPQTVYDQKQTGDYNIQLHLKDFQIIALLGEDSIGALGDYDYNYDYSDFTVKPGSQKPSSQATSSTTQSISTTTPAPQKPSNPQTVKPSNHPYPILTPSTTQPPKEKPTSVEQQTPSEKPAQSSNSANEADKTEKPATTSSSDKIKVELVGSATTNKNVTEELNPPGKIKVQIIETPLSVVPGEEVHKQGAPVEGEIVHLRRCSTGFARDKKGRCRRVRRPATGASQLPYGFGRLASNLVSRFRQASSDTSLSSSSESAED